VLAKDVQDVQHQVFRVRPRFVPPVIGFGDDDKNTSGPVCSTLVPIKCHI
jgi:hypothetical protein